MVSSAFSTATVVSTRRESCHETERESVRKKEWEGEDDFYPTVGAFREKTRERETEKDKEGEREKTRERRREMSWEDFICYRWQCVKESRLERLQTAF